MAKRDAMKHLLFIGTTLPTPGFGSSVIFYRHLKRLKDWNITIIINIDGGKEKLPKEWSIIKIPDLVSGNKKWYHLPVKSRISLTLRLRLNYLKSIIERNLKEKPIVILNQFGKNSILACYLSKKWKAPLNLIVHDQWNIWVKTGIESYYMEKEWEKKILNQASVIWPVSKELGEFYKTKDKEKAKVLMPIPEGNDKGFAEWKNNFKKPTIVFAGSYHTPYVESFKLVSKALQKLKGKLIIITKKNNLAEKEIGNYSNIEYKKPFKSNEEIIKFLKQNASCLLVPGFFNRDKKVEYDLTNFPSKLVEFSHLGLPIIIISPKGNALSNWAEKNNWIGYLDRLDKKKMIKLIKQIINRYEWVKMAQQSKIIALNEFNPEKIQERFERELVVKE